MRLAFGIAVVASLAAGSARACDGDVILLQDHFDGLSTIWETTSPPKIVEGQMEVRTKVGKSDKVFATPLYKDVDACADVEVTAGSNLASVYVGIGFWATDYQNLYTFQITPEGYAGVYRLKDDEWETVQGDVKSESIHTGRDQMNKLRVVTSGETATLYINGDKFGDPVKGVPPTGGQRIGLVVESSDQSAATFRFDDFTATAPD